MTAEEFVVQYLNSELPVPVSGDIPAPRPQRFVTVEQTGSRFADFLYHPTIAVQSWAESRVEAARLNALVKNAMTKITNNDGVSSCTLSNDYNHPDLDSRTARYQAIFSITYLQEET